MVIFLEINLAKKSNKLMKSNDFNPPLPLNPGDGIRCVSINPDYPEFVIPKNEIYTYNLVVGLIRL